MSDKPNGILINPGVIPGELISLIKGRNPYFNMSEFIRQAIDEKINRLDADTIWNRPKMDQVVVDVLEEKT